MVVLIVSMGKLVANVFHNEWWKCGHVTCDMITYMYSVLSCKIVVHLMAHLQQF